MKDINNFAWRKASRSNTADNCVEAAALDDRVGVRDTKDRERGHLELEPHAWTDFLRQVAQG